MPDVTMHELACVIGHEATKRAVEAFAGRRCLFSKKPSALEFSSLSEMRRRFRDLLFLEGRTPAEIAEEYGLTSKHVKRVINSK